MRARLTAKVQLHRISLLGAILVGFALRHFRLGGESLWYDETVSVYLAQKTIPAMLAHTAGDIHPPGYYLLLHFWQLLTHPTLEHGLEFLYAWPSLFFGMLLIVFIYTLGRKLWNRNCGLIAAWLTAIHPFHLWYSQEVRMYTLGAALGLLCLWALLQIADSKRTISHAVRWLAIYSLTAAMGMYTLYYFVFLLLALNLLAYFLLRHQGRKLLTWLLAQGGALLLWLPWLSIFVHQALDPPVPPWRVPWQQASGILAAVAESLSVFVTGQSPPLVQNGLWAVLTSALLTLFFYTKSTSQQTTISSKWIVTIYLFVPIGLIYLITFWLTPLYHVRYLFTYAPPFALVVAYVIDRYSKQFQLATLLGLFGLLLINAASLYEFWQNPLYRSDDHRGAVADLARNWRPGDSILVNAGWAYPPLLIYWPTELRGPLSFLPPGLEESKRLGDWEIGASPVAIRTGSVDGSANLGWGDAESDFFAISRSETLGVLEAMAQQSASIWHYRIYDTVSDPAGVIRDWLSQLSLVSDQPYPGRDYLRVQHFLVDESQRFKLAGYAETLLAPASQPLFGDILRLTGSSMAHSNGDTAGVHAGEERYLLLDWLPQRDLAILGVDLSMSLRLYDPQDNLVAQHDEAPLLPTGGWQANHHYTQAMVLGIPVATKPGTYSLQIVVYRQDNGEALSLTESPSVIQGQRYQIGQVAIQFAQQPPEIDSVIASFDYIDLLTAQADRSQLAAGDLLPIELIWRGRPSGYRDSYAARIDLVNAAGESVQIWRGLIGGDDYPSSEWSALLPVREFRQLTLNSDLITGTYSLRLRLERNSDQRLIPAQQGWGWFKQNDLEIGIIQIQSKG